MDTVKDFYFSDFESAADGSQGSFAKLLKTLSDVWEEIPLEHRDLAACLIEIEHGYYDDSPSLTTEVFHIRAKTEEEIKEEQAVRARQHEHAIQRATEQEKRDWARLRAKYGS